MICVMFFCIYFDISRSIIGGVPKSTEVCFLKSAVARLRGITIAEISPSI